MLAACSTVPGKKKESTRDILEITMKEWADVSKSNTSKKRYMELPPTRNSVWKETLVTELVPMFF